ncbi:MAG TPA: hypothetical protein VGO93_03660 [Candidatus Xenobia bacterium]|jgi:hypothetical protein
MKRWTLAVLAMLATAWAADRPLTIVVAGPSTPAMVAELERLKSDNHAPLVIVQPSATELAQMAPRLGLAPADLPWVFVGTPEHIALGPGNVPALVRRVKSPATAADLMFARWAQLAQAPVSPDVQLLAEAFVPGKEVVLVAARTTAEADRLAAPLRQKCSVSHISTPQLPILVSGQDHPLLDPQDFLRLGFGDDALPCIGLIQMTQPPPGAGGLFEAGHPGRIVDGLLLRNVGNAEWAGDKILRAWAKASGTTLATDEATPTLEAASATPEVEETIVAGGPPVSVTPTAATPSGPVVTVPAGTSVKIRCLEDIDFKNGTRGTVVLFEAAQDVVVKGQVVIRAGARCDGLMREVEGSQGLLAVEIHYVQMVDGASVKVRGIPIIPVGADSILTRGTEFEVSTDAETTVRPR